MTDDEMRAANKSAFRKGLPLAIDEFKEMEGVGIEPKIDKIREKILELMNENEEREDPAREELEPFSLLANEIEIFNELEEELNREFSGILKIQINPTQQMFGFNGMVQKRKAEVIIIDFRFQEELPEFLERYREEMIFEKN